MMNAIKNDDTSWSSSSCNKASAKACEISDVVMMYLCSKESCEDYLR